MSEQFNGFPKDIWPFLDELIANNDRGWFNANKQRYKDTVVGPMSDFIAAIAPALDDIAPYFIADARPNGGSMFRIYRDVRFSKDKKPYKEHVACQFRHQAGKDAHAPGFYLHMDPQGPRFGGGLYLPPSEPLAKVRAKIAGQPERWLGLKQDPDFLRLFGDVQGESLKRAPKNYSPDHEMIEDLKKKTFFIMARASRPDIHKPEFVRQVADGFEKAGPFMKFLTTAVDLPY